jgi:cell division septum initiation protein DivIVA
VTIGSPSNSVQTTGGIPSSTGPFDIVRRGYDRDQVDEQLRELRDRLSAAESGRQAAEQHAHQVEKELRTLRQQQTEGPISQESFGFRAEKILRLAEHEAADVRNRAANEASALVEQARADAERHRHEVEQKLIVRSAELDQEAAKRNVAIQEREQQAAATLAAAREDASRITEDARHAAEALVTEAQNRADEVRQRSEQDLKRRRDAAEQELRRIGSLHEGVRNEMARLHKLLGAELGEGANKSSSASGGDISERAALPMRSRPQLESSPVS